MPLKLAAFDLDGTLLTNDKRLTPANNDALEDMHRNGLHVALASGRLGSSVMHVADLLDFEPCLMTLNGAAVYRGKPSPENLVYSAPLEARFADYLVEYATGKGFAINYYIDGSLYSIHTEKTDRWNRLYNQQTQTPCTYLPDLAAFAGRTPFKVIFVGEPVLLDELQESFRALWDGQVYMCRTWEYYLEFLDLEANKARGIEALAHALGVSLADAVAFGDAENDIPMLEACGIGIAVRNASEHAKTAAKHVSEWSNEEDAVAKEWQRLKAQPGLVTLTHREL